MITREFRCVAHDFEFESEEEKPCCPHGCSASFVVMEFRSPPSIRHAGTRLTDVMQSQLAQDYGMTDMRGDKDGTSVMSNTRASSGGARKSFNPEQQVRWAPSLFQPQQGWAQRSEAEPVYTHNLPGTKNPMKPYITPQPGRRLRDITQFVKAKGEK